MKRGRKPSPRHLHVLRGTDREDAGTGDAATGPTGDLPGPPEHLGPDARAFWLDVRRELLALGLGTSCDVWDLEAAATLYGRARRAEEACPPGGFFICAKTGNPKRHPAAVEALQARKELRILLEAMGLSTPGRVRVLGTAKRPQAPDPAESFFDHAGHG